MGLLHGVEHVLGNLLGLLQETELVLVFLGPGGDNSLPVDNEALGLLHLMLSSVLGSDGDLEEFVVSVHVSVSSLLLSDGGISEFSGSVSLGFPVSSELLHISLLDLLVL